MEVKILGNYSELLKKVLEELDVAYRDLGDKYKINFRVEERNFSVFFWIDKNVNALCIFIFGVRDVSEEIYYEVVELLMDYNLSILYGNLSINSIENQKSIVYSHGISLSRGAEAVLFKEEIEETINYSVFTYININEKIDRLESKKYEYKINN